MRVDLCLNLSCRAMLTRATGQPPPTRCPKCFSALLPPPRVTLADRTRAGLAPLPDGGLDDGRAR